MFATLQQPEWRHVEVRVVNRWAVYRGSRVVPAFLTELGAGGHPVAVWLRGRAEAALNRWWRSANYPPGHPGRGTLSADRDRRWFVDSSLDDRDPVSRGGDDPVFDLLPAVRLYDVVAGVASIEPAYFEPSIREEQPHVKVIGARRKAHGVPYADELTSWIMELLRLGLQGAPLE